MEQKRVIQVKQNILAKNDAAADEFRAQRKAEGTFFVDLMASPGAGKTTLLLALIEKLRQRGFEKLGVIEADLESDVDALKIKAAGVPSVELNTRGVCHVEMGMVNRAFDAFCGQRFDFLFLENIGNLVCPAEFDTGAGCNLVLLSVPEGDDKPLKYPLMFEVASAVVITKTDTAPAFDFSMDRARENIHRRNPEAPVFAVSALTGDGVEAVADYLRREAARLK